MQRLIIEMESEEKARELGAVLAELKFVRGVTAVTDVAELPQPVYKSADAFWAEIDRRTGELESGAVKGLSYEELEAGARRITAKRA